MLYAQFGSLNKLNMQSYLIVPTLPHHFTSFVQVSSSSYATILVI